MASGSSLVPRLAAVSRLDTIDGPCRAGNGKNRCLNKLVQSVQNCWVKTHSPCHITGNTVSVQRLILVVLLLALVPVAAYTAVGTMHNQAHVPVVSPSTTTNASVSISVSGNATKIGNSTRTAPSTHNHADSTAASSPALGAPPDRATVTASVTIKATVIRTTNGTMLFNVTGTSLTIGSTTYTVTNGSGIFNQHSMIVVLHATVTNGGTTGHMILVGRVTATLTGEGAGNGFSVAFGSPQSKLASSFFLSVDGTMTIS